MKFAKTRILGSSYIGLFTVTNDSLCFVPKGTDDKTKKALQKGLDTNVAEAKIYDSPLLAVFSKMNNKKIFLPSYALENEIEDIEKAGIKAEIIETEQAIGNLMAVNDTSAILSKTLKEESAEALRKSGLTVLQENIAKTDAVGSSLLLTNKSFLINPNASEEEIKKIQDTLNITGGASTANTGDSFVRNSVVANSKGFVAGMETTGHELNRIEEALQIREEE